MRDVESSMKWWRRKRRRKDETGRRIQVMICMQGREGFSGKGFSRKEDSGLSSKSDLGCSRCVAFCSPAGNALLTGGTRTGCELQSLDMDQIASALRSVFRHQLLTNLLSATSTNDIPTSSTSPSSKKRRLCPQRSSQASFIPSSRSRKVSRPPQSSSRLSFSSLLQTPIPTQPRELDLVPAERRRQVESNEGSEEKVGKKRNLN